MHQDVRPQRQLGEAHAERGGTSGTAGLGLLSGRGVTMRQGLQWPVTWKKQVVG